MSDDDKKVDPTKPIKPDTLPVEPDKPVKPAPDFQDGMKEDGNPNQ